MCKLSVVIPVRNLEGYISRCIGSILQQSFTDYEIVMVFDDCTNKSKQISSELLKAVPHKFIDVKCNSAGLTRNAGLEVAVGEYIWFIDGDDYLIRSDAFEIIIDKLQKTGATVGWLRNNVGTYSKRPVIWRLILSRNLIGSTRFTAMKSGQSYPFYDEIRAKQEYIQCDIDEVIYHYSNDRAESISKVFPLIQMTLLRLSQKRTQP